MLKCLQALIQSAIFLFGIPESGKSSFPVLALLSQQDISYQYRIMTSLIPDIMHQLQTIRISAGDLGQILFDSVQSADLDIDKKEHRKEDQPDDKAYSRGYRIFSENQGMFHHRKLQRCGCANPARDICTLGKINRNHIPAQYGVSTPGDHPNLGILRNNNTEHIMQFGA